MAKKTERRELTEAEKACAQRAKDLWEQKQKREGIPNQNIPAHALGITQSGFSQFVNGQVPMPAEMKSKLAGYLQVSIKAIDPNFYNDIGLPDPDLDDIEADALKQFRRFHEKEKAILLGMLISSVSTLEQKKRPTKHKAEAPKDEHGGGAIQPGVGQTKQASKDAGPQKIGAKT